VLVAGGFNGGLLASAELYDVGLGFSSAWQPQITTAPATLVSGNKLILTGFLFKGISQASGGNFQDSSSNYPVVQLRSIDNGQVAFLPVDPTAGWSDTAFTSIPVSGFPFGPALVTVFTNGIPSAAKYLVFSAPSLVLNSATSLAIHPILPFEINLPLSGNPGIECRSSDGSGGAGSHTILFYFGNQISSVNNASVSCGSVTSFGLNGNPTNSCFVQFSGGSCNQQYVTVTLTGVHDSYGQTLASASVTVGLLLGDTTGNGSVNSSDIAQTQAASGQMLDATNFREDVTVNGQINSSDISMVQAQSGTALGSPPAPIGSQRTPIRSQRTKPIKRSDRLNR